MNYTKGDWKIVKDKQTEPPKIERKDGLTIAYLVTTTTLSGKTLPLVEAEANARLIAAAPTLLEACERYVRVQEEVYAEMGRKPTSTMYQIMKAAIAVAKGT